MIVNGPMMLTRHPTRQWYPATTLTHCLASGHGVWASGAPMIAMESEREPPKGNSALALRAVAMVTAVEEHTARPLAARASPSTGP